MIRIRSRVITLDSVDIMQLFGLMDNWTQNRFLSSWTLACLQLDLAGWWLSDFWSSCSSGFRHSHAPWTAHDSWKQYSSVSLKNKSFSKKTHCFAEAMAAASSPTQSCPGCGDTRQATRSFLFFMWITTSLWMRTQMWMCRWYSIRPDNPNVYSTGSLSCYYDFNDDNYN